MTEQEYYADRYLKGKNLPNYIATLNKVAPPEFEFVAEKEHYNTKSFVLYLKEKNGVEMMPLTEALSPYALAKRIILILRVLVCIGLFDEVELC